MNRNTILALALVLLVVAVFQSPQYTKFIYETILHQPVPMRTVTLPSAPVVDTNTANATTPAPALVQAPTAIAPVVAPVEALTDSAVPVSVGVQAETLWVETPRVICGISTEGARIICLKAKGYTYHVRGGKQARLAPDPNDLIDLVYDSVGGANLALDARSYDQERFLPQDTVRRVVLGAGDSVRVRLMSQGASPVWKEFVFRADSYAIGLAVGGARVAGHKVSVGWQSGITESERRRLKIEQLTYDQRTIHLFDGKNIDHRQYAKKPTQDTITGDYRWVALSSKYFLCGIVANQSGDADVQVRSWKVAGDATTKTPEFNYSVSVVRSCDDSVVNYTLYLGPSRLGDLSRLGVGLERALFGSVDGGFGYWAGFFFFRADLWFPWICQAVLWLLIQLQKGLLDFGIVIITLTLISKIITFPLTHSSMKSMSRMKDVQPKVEAIRQRYKSNPQKMNAEILALYKSEGINPFNPGCLPMIMQMPIFIALFIVLRKAIELRGATTFFLPWVSDLSQPEALPIITPLFQMAFPNGLPMYGSTVGLLPILMAAVTFVQNKMTIKDPNQKAMIYFFPVFMLVMFNSFSAGLVLYWTFSTIVGIVQQYFTEKYRKSRAALAPAVVVTASEANRQKARKRGRF